MKTVIIRVLYLAFVAFWGSIPDTAVAKTKSQYGASVMDERMALELSPSVGLTWGDQIVATLKATIEADGEEHTHFIEVRGRVNPRFSLEPHSASFGVGTAQRRAVRQVIIGLPADLAEAPVKASPLCEGVELKVEYQREEDNSLVVKIGNASDFPVGALGCGVEVHIGAEQVIIPVLALTSPPQ
ncbi:MAG: hypothetical protein OXM01_04755 [Gemmatimonadota bacterium]|nr:hypothetical protein [Gemmatimonadota bacterium]